MILYAVPVSAFSLRVRLALAWKAIAFEERLPPGGTYRSPEYRAIVPTGRVPALLHDGAQLIESDAICEYLEDLAPRPALLPGTPAQRAVARFLSRHHDFDIEPAVRALFPYVGKAAGAPAPDALRAKLELAAGFLPGGPFLAGAQPSLADFSWAATFTLTGALAQAFGWPELLPPRMVAARDALREEPRLAAPLGAYATAAQTWIAARRA